MRSMRLMNSGRKKPESARVTCASLKAPPSETADATDPAKPFGLQIAAPPPQGSGGFLVWSKGGTLPETSQIAVAWPLVAFSKLLDDKVISGMKPGSVIVDLGADGGGNCTLSRPGETVRAHGVTILAPLNLPATVPHHASMLFSRNLLNFFTAFWNTKDKKLELDFADDILAGAVITRDGAIVHAPTKKLT